LALFSKDLQNGEKLAFSACLLACMDPITRMRWRGANGLLQNEEKDVIRQLQKELSES
jgi:hypothetical protein